ncbi:unnamed protein product (macronuclear) [Paramecium tetraurelia]|uniref:Uncharacterized protein n=1 Tax=Paramecium tetraurelia TaxID=5888 RepID=A0DL11_PARTE|nr:uncharacterized protein GSPATT00018045001 [Paramecium tetraurelia]CAK83728.1 unnamed protein product [Paramecium tetraurelia]|eukprot:XP_001451125.1 hypothetical protein (macronuclear) [Paramecium tetraurelia strain d4-2]
MRNKDDPRDLFQYHFEQRQHLIRYKKKLSQSEAHSSNQASIMNIFATQVGQVAQEIVEATIEDEIDLKLLELIKNVNNELNECILQQDLLAFTDQVVQNYQEYKEQFDRLGVECIQLKEKKYELQSNMREIIYCKYPETSNGLLPLKLEILNFLLFLFIQNFLIQQVCFSIKTFIVYIRQLQQQLDYFKYIINKC